MRKLLDRLFKRTAPSPAPPPRDPAAEAFAALAQLCREERAAGRPVRLGPDLSTLADPRP